MYIHATQPVTLEETRPALLGSGYLPPRPTRSPWGMGSGRQESTYSCTRVPTYPRPAEVEHTPDLPTYPRRSPPPLFTLRSFTPRRPLRPPLQRSRDGSACLLPAPTSRASHPSAAFCCTDDHRCTGSPPHPLVSDHQRGGGCLTPTTVTPRYPRFSRDLTEILPRRLDLPTYPRGSRAQ